jgi:pimeloyl-ACP methyl ester carboxylesterase
MLATLPGCLLVNAHSSPASLPSAGGLTYVADGSGDLRQVADALGIVAADAHAPMRVERIPWSYGKGAILPDLYGAEHHQAEGRALANQIVAHRKAHPTDRICLVGYSSGASVALAATDSLPPQTIDRFILLSPTVAARHDLRPALRASREGIDVFNSEWDLISMVALFAMGTGDGVGRQVAGWRGFVQVGDTQEDTQLYKGLRQHFWEGPEQWSGHDGSHFGCCNKEFLRAQVLPRVLGKQ